MKYRAVSLITVVCLAAACSAPEVGQWQTFCVDADAHAFKPAALILGHEKVITYQWEFSTSMRYNLGNGDQCDWNKLHGVSWQLLTNHEDALMVAWRWNIAGYWEVAPYYHHEGNTYWAGGCNQPEAMLTDPEITITKVYPGELFLTTLTLAKDGRASVEIRTNYSYTYFDHYFGIEADNKYREIGPWFGGNRTAPHAMCMQRKRL